MIYIFTALHCEASVFIRQFHLAKNPENTRFQEFYNGTADIRLTVTGVGEIAAATVVGSVCTAYRPTEGDILFNIGTCARQTGNNGVFLCNKIIEQVTGKTFYPDMLYRHDFDEEAVVTGMFPWNGENHSAEPLLDHLGGKLYDMEAAAIYQAGSSFFGPHQMMFLKVVSDGGTAKEISKKQVEQLMEKYKDSIFSYISQMQMIARKNGHQRNCLHPEKEDLIEKLCTDLHCSKTMGDSLRQHIRYQALAGSDYYPVIQEMYGEGLLPCKDKREGKLCFEELKRRLL